MKLIFRKPLRNYVIGLFLLTIAMGIILWKTHGDLILFVAALIVEFILVTILLMNVFEKYVKPLDKVIETVDEFVNGNFLARVRQQAEGKAGELSNKINILARNLSDLSTHEQMQKEQLSTIVNNTESGIVLIDEKGYIHYVNRKFIEMFGKTTKDYNGFLYYDVMDNIEIHQAVQETFLYETNVKSFFAKTDQLITSYIEIMGAPIFDEKNALKGAVLVMYDITEFKNLEFIRKDFVANVSHELKTPITSIKGFAETLIDGAMDEQETRETFIKIIYDESNRLQFLIDDLLTLSRLEHDGFYLHITKKNILEIVSEIEPILQSRATKKQIDLRFNIESIEASVDSEKMKQVIFNLVDNAISYTPENGIVTLTIYKNEDNLLIEIMDTGIGIEKEKVSRLFERFYRVDQARSRNTGGTGLGLAIVKHIVELHGGLIEIESVIDEGSTFTVKLPLKDISE